MALFLLVRDSLEKVLVKLFVFPYLAWFIIQESFVTVYIPVLVLRVKDDDDDDDAGDL